MSKNGPKRTHQPETQTKIRRFVKKKIGVFPSPNESHLRFVSFFDESHQNDAFPSSVLLHFVFRFRFRYGEPSSFVSFTSFPSLRFPSPNLNPNPQIPKLELLIAWTSISLFVGTANHLKFLLCWQVKERKHNGFQIFWLGPFLLCFWTSFYAGFFPLLGVFPFSWFLFTYLDFEEALPPVTIQVAPLFSFVVLCISCLFVLYFSILNFLFSLAELFVCI